MTVHKAEFDFISAGSARQARRPPFASPSARREGGRVP